MYKKIAIVTLALILLASGCLSSQNEEVKESDAGNGTSSNGNGEISSTAANSSPDNQFVNESRNSEQVPQKHQILVPPHTATEIVYQGYGDDIYGNYLLLNTTEHTFFVNQTGTKDDFAGNYKETSQTYNLNGGLGTTSVFIKENNGVSFEGSKGGKVLWERVD